LESTKLVFLRADYQRLFSKPRFGDCHEETYHLHRRSLSRSELHPKAMEEQMTRQPIFVEDNTKPLKPKADDQSHEPAKHIEETARLASSVETAKDPSKVRRTKD
jgi:hypothetical protein